MQNIDFYQIKTTVITASTGSFLGKRYLKRYLPLSSYFIYMPGLNLPRQNVKVLRNVSWKQGRSIGFRNSCGSSRFYHPVPHANNWSLGENCLSPTHLHLRHIRNINHIEYRSEECVEGRFRPNLFFTPLLFNGHLIDPDWYKLRTKENAIFMSEGAANLIFHHHGDMYKTHWIIQNHASLTNSTPFHPRPFFLNTLSKQRFMQTPQVVVMDRGLSSKHFGNSGGFKGPKIPNRTAPIFSKKDRLRIMLSVRISHGKILAGRSSQNVRSCAIKNDFKPMAYYRASYCFWNHHQTNQM